MRMPRTQLGLDSHRERRLLNAFVKLKKMGMTGPDADPDNFHHSFWRKGSNSLHGQEKGAKFNHFQFFMQGMLDVLRNVWEKAQREMNLIAGRPANTWDPRIEIDQKLSDRWGRID